MPDHSPWRPLILTACLLAIVPGPRSLTAQGGGPTRSGTLDRSFALFRLPGQAGASCASCHRAGPPPETSSPDSLRAHVAVHLPGVTSAELADLQRYLGTLRPGPPLARPSASTEMVEAVRGLGYVEYRTGPDLPVLRRGLRLNAHELSRVATGRTRLVPSASSPTGMALELDGTSLTGLVLAPVGADPGSYLLTLPLAGPAPETPFRMSLTSEDSPPIDGPVRRSSNPSEAAASFQVARAVPLTVALAPAGGATVSITELIIERQ